MSGGGGDDAASTARREATVRDDIATFASANGWEILMRRKEKGISHSKSTHGPNYTFHLNFQCYVNVFHLVL